MQEQQQQQQEQEEEQQQQEQQQRPSVLSYSTGWVANGLSWSTRENAPFRFAVSSYIQEYKNHVDIVQKNEEGNLVCRATWEHCYPPTKVMFAPQKAATDLIITTADYLRLWEVKEGPPEKSSDEKRREVDDPRRVPSKSDHIDSHVVFKTVFDSGKQPNEFCFPVTSCDWNSDDPNILGCCSVDTTVTIWEIETGKNTRLIAHDKDVYDIAFAKGTHTFASCGADGSVRVFDLREIEHCTILYESSSLSPLLRVAWDKVDQTYLYTFGVEGTEVIVIDIRFPAVPLGVLRNSRTQPFNSVCWAPNSVINLCSGGEDGTACIWDLGELPNVAPKCIMNYRGDHPINNISWSSQHEQWIAITTGKQAKLLHV
ncbi:WD repeat-containing protein 68 [Trypanosoma grayi]|uniref:WD repeat-containing protein 68 n=1 Tax=Trypanosoma grayi TaxID=71804 RepID=UPI0004F4A137|nr:WD repeat-containing protein 68 [Trypanosoma grayi]KEG14944.1 WD repeat-containing protein 68 [Trypanosoma grayi]